MSHPHHDDDVDVVDEDVGVQIRRALAKEALADPARRAGPPTESLAISHGTSDGGWIAHTLPIPERPQPKGITLGDVDELGEKAWARGYEDALDHLTKALSDHLGEIEQAHADELRRRRQEAEREIHEIQAAARQRAVAERNTAAQRGAEDHARAIGRKYRGELGHKVEGADLPLEGILGDLAYRTREALDRAEKDPRRTTRERLELIMGGLSLARRGVEELVDLGPTAGMEVEG